VLAVAPELHVDDLVGALEANVDPEDAQRATRAGGMLDEAGILLPLVRAAVGVDLSVTAKTDIHDRLAISLLQHHRGHAAESVMAGRGRTPGSEEVLIEVARGLQRTDPSRAIDMADHGLACGFGSAHLPVIKARAAYEQGSREAFGYVDEVPREARLEVADVEFGLAVRDLRWQSAASRPVQGEVARPMGQLATLLSGEIVEAEGEPTDTGVNARLISTLIANLVLTTEGESRSGLAGLAEVADDFDRIHCEIPLGITAHAIGAAAAINTGDLAMAEGLLNQALLAQSGGEGEEMTHRLLYAYSRLLGGNFEEALKAVREGESNSWSLRDRFLLAAIDAAIGRRSGDTTRLRGNEPTRSWCEPRPVGFSPTSQSSCWRLGLDWAKYAECSRLPTNWPAS